jgi:uncharacterized membrane protein YkvA (DUF1232 family)
MSSKLPANSEGHVSFLAGLVNQLRLVWLLMMDNRISMWVKSVVPLSFLYTISPVDFIPDVILGLGQLDDLGVILLGLALFVKLSPPELVEYYRQQIEYGHQTPLDVKDDDSIDTTYKILDDDETSSRTDETGNE